MNFSLILGLLFGLGTIALSIFSEIKNPLTLVNPHALMIVVGGTLFAGLICFKHSHLTMLLKVLFNHIVGRKQQEIEHIILEAVAIAKKSQAGKPIEAELSKVKNPFFKEALTLYCQQTLSAKELDEVLEKRVHTQNKIYRKDGAIFKIVGKFPPAFGLIGTSLGMITLLQSLGEGGAFEKLGPAMSTALTATFYGLVLSNSILIPLGEHLTSASEDDLMMRRIVLDAIKLIREQKHPALVQEYLISYLRPNERDALTSSLKPGKVESEKSAA